MALGSELLRRVKEKFIDPEPAPAAPEAEFNPRDEPASLFIVWPIPGETDL